MQRKAIEKIQYLKAHTVQGAGLKYVTAADIKQVNNTDVLILEIYKNHKNMIGIPVVRICLTKDDYENYYPADDRWSKKKIAVDYCWNTEILGKYSTIRTFKSEVHFSDETKKKINGFLKCKREDRHVIYAINEAEENIERKKEDRKVDNAEKKIKDLLKLAPEHSKTFYEWAKGLIPDNYMYYLRKKNTVFLTCTHCGSREKYYTGLPVTIEDYAKTYIDVPKPGNKCVCRFCNAPAEYKQEGHYKGPWEKNIYAYDIQNSEGKAVITLMNVKKIYENGEAEKYEFKELVKAVYSAGRRTSDKAYKSGNKWVSRNGKIGWDGCWNYDHIDLADVEFKQVYGFGKLKDTPIRYCGMEEFLKKRMKTSPIRYADAYLKSPELEMLSKLGLTYIADSTIRRGKQIADGKKPYMMLGIYPERLNMLIKAKGAENLWDVLKMEKSTNEHFDNELIDKLRKNTRDIGNIKTCLKYMTYKKFSNYMDKHKWNIITYSDYLAMKDRAGYNMKDSITLFPKDLERAHTEITLEIERKKSEQRQKEMNEKYTKIAKDFKQLNSIYGYKTEKFIIRPAKTAGEIVVEGTTLHHCVDSSNVYMENHNNGKRYIMFLRKISEPDIPYCTVELAEDFKVIQRHQAYDETPDAEEIDKFLKEYVKAKTLKQAI